MFRRILWLTIGIVAGVLIWRKVTKVAHSYSPEGLTERAQVTANKAADGLRGFAQDVKVLAQAKEQELRQELAANNPNAAAQPQPRYRRKGDGREFRTP